MGTEEIELEGLDYIIKFKERLEIVMAYINNGTDISDEDYSVIQEILRIYCHGRLRFYKTISTQSAITTTEPDLFCQNVSTTHGGTKVANVKVNIKH